MMKRASRNVLILLLFVGLSACSRPAVGPEQQIRNWVATGVDAAERKDRGEIIDMISPRYNDRRGNSREDIDKLLRLYFFRTDKVKLLEKIEEVRVIAETAAEVLLTVGMAGSSDNILGFRADAYKFALELEYDGEEWLLISARWGQLGEDGIW
jgi:hypothetical protein